MQAALNEVLQSQSVQELEPVLEKYPALLEEETMKAVAAWRDKAWQDGEKKLAEALHEALMRIASVVQLRSEAEAAQSVPPIEPKVAWAINARRYLVGHSDEARIAAIKEADKQNEVEIFRFLKLCAKFFDPEIEKLARKLVPELQRHQRHEEAMTVYLLWLDTQVAWLFISDRYPADQQARAREAGIQACTEAARFSALLNDKRCQAKYSKILADEFKRSRRFDEVIRYRTDELRLYRELAEHEPQTYQKKIAETLYHLGDAQANRGNAEDAERHYSEALDLFWELAKKDPDMSYRDDLSGLLTNLGEYQYEKNNLEAAERFYNEAILMLWRMDGEPPIHKGLAMALNNYAVVMRDQGRPAIAEDFHMFALKIRQELAKQEGDIHKGNLAQTYLNLSFVQCDQDKFEDGKQSLTKALELYRDLAKRAPEIYLNDVANTLNTLGAVQTDGGDLPGGERSFNEALAIRRELARRTPHDQDLASTLQNLGHLHMVKLSPKKARDYFEEARELIEGALEKAVTLDERNGIMQRNTVLFDNLILCHLRLQDRRKVLEIAEASKSRSLNYFLNLKSDDFMPKAPSADAQATVQVLGKRYNETIRLLKEVTNQEKFSDEQIMAWWDVVESDEKRKAVEFHFNNKDAMSKERFRLTDVLRGLEAEIRAYDEHFPPKANPISVETIFELSARANRAIVMFRVMIDSTVIIFVFPNRELVVEELPNLNRQKLFRWFYQDWLLPYENWKRERVDIDILKESIAKVLRELDEKLMFKVWEVLDARAGITEVLFVPNQSLALLPLHAASWTDEGGNRRYLLEKYTITYASSISVFKRCQENQSPRTNTTLFVTNPTDDEHLRYSEEEVREIRSLEGHRRHQEFPIGGAAKSAVVKALEGDFGFIHFSCHGFYNYYNAFHSGLVMTDDVLSLSEIVNCNLRNNWLTTLSACETGMVDFRSPTDEHFGLPLGFIFAGSPSVWASLWAVSDYATSHLMTEAYKNLNKEEYKSSKAGALRQAQLEIMKKLPHPFYWAGFQHFGV